MHDYTKKSYTTQKWDIKKNIIPPISDDFFKYFTCGDVPGDDDYVTYNGLIALAHEKGLVSLEVDILQYPNKDNAQTTVAKASLIGYAYDKQAEKIVKAKFSAIGDSNPKSLKSSFILPHAIRMAATRAKGRALRDYLNIGMVVAEECGSIIDQPPATNDQKTKIKELIKQKVIKKNQNSNKLVEITGKPKLSADFKIGHAVLYIDWLESLPDKPTEEKPKEDTSKDKSLKDGK